MLALLGTTGAAPQEHLAARSRPRPRQENEEHDASPGTRGSGPMSTRTLDLRRCVRRDPIPALEIGDVTAADLEAARTNWRARMASEHASARVFGALVGGMMNAGLPADETYRVADMVRQELEHARLCARVLVALRSAPVAELSELPAVPEHADATPLEAVLRNVISIGCCSETVAVALVATEREQAGPPQVRRVLDQILRDEIKHSRFGWRLVSRLAPALTPQERASLGEYLVDAFAHQIRFHAPFLDMPCATEAGLAIGAPHGRSNWLVFVATMEDVVVPGLERCGLAASEAWREVTRAGRAAA